MNAVNTVLARSKEAQLETMNLRRELSSIKPELESLRSQNALNQELMQQKEKLQRSVASLELALATERRAGTHIRSDKALHATEDTKQLELLREEIVREKRAWQKHQLDFDEKLGQWELEKASLEGKVDSLRATLRREKENLKKVQSKLQAGTAKRTLVSDKASMRAGAFDLQKRSLIRFDPDTSIGTPGTAADAKKVKRLATIPGDKSTFSITPFLNRTTLHDCDPLDAEQQNETVFAASPTMLEKTAGAGTTGIGEMLPMQIHKPQGERSSGTLKRIRPECESTRGPDKSASKPRLGSTELVPRPELYRVQRSTVKSNMSDVLEDSTDKAKSVVVSQPRSRTDVASKLKRKRKILGGIPPKSLFDEDDADDFHGVRRTAQPVSKYTNLRGKGEFLNKSLTSLKAGAFMGEFSPLKRR